MKDLETQKQFIELRAKGNSFDSIAKTMNIAKSTLIKWSKVFENEISELEKIELNEIKEKLMAGKKHRVEMMSEMLNEIRAETFFLFYFHCIKCTTVRVNSNKKFFLWYKI